MAFDTTRAEQRYIFDIPLDALTITQAVAYCLDAVEHGRYASIAVINAAKVMWMRRDAGLRRAIIDCDLILADGQSVVWASRLLGAPLPERVAGIDLFTELLASAEQRGYGVYFLGARPEVLARMLVVVGQRFPNLVIAGARDGYFGAEEEPGIVDEIRDSRASLLFLGMSSPKKENFLNRWGQDTGVRVAHGVGGSFDVLAGVTTRAPLWWQRHGLEWFYRACQEPLRLGPRYLKTNLSFIKLVGSELVKTGGGKQLISLSGSPDKR